jgi:prevent-host-death family protein
MKRIAVADDIKPISEFRSNAKALISQVHSTKRPLVITQNGKSAAVLMDVLEYQKMVEMLEVQAEIFNAEEDIVNKKTMSSKSARTKVLGSIKQ